MTTKDRPGMLRLMAQDAKPRNGVVHDVVAERGLMSLPGALTETSFTMPPDTTLEEWAAAGATLDRIHKSWKFWLADWLNFGEDHWPEEYAQFMNVSDLPEQSINNIRSVARNIPQNMRHKELSFTAHAAVVPLVFKERAGEIEGGTAMKVLDQAVVEQWPREYLRQVVKANGDPDAIPPAVFAEVAEPCECYCCKSDFCKDCGHPWGS